MSLWRLAICALAAGLLFGCATPAVQSARPADRPPAADSDEAGLILQMQRYEEDLEHSPLRVTDPPLNAYLRDLTCTVAGDYCPNIRVYLLRQPYFNAAMAPNGMLVIWTGLLLRVDDEAQLAAVIGHEVGHYVARDSLSRWRKLKSTSSLTTAFQVLSGGIGAGVVGAVASLGAYGSLFAFSRDQERAADDFGLQRMRELGYDDARAGALWAAVWEEERVRDRQLLSAIFASHPASEERRDRLVAAASHAGGRTEATRYRQVTASLRSGWLEDEIGRRHYSQTRVLLERLAGQTDAGGGIHYFYAEMYRRRAQAGDLPLAEQEYRTALQAADAPASAWRGLGLTLRQQGRTADARAAFVRYLSAAPAASDRAMIESWIE